VKYAFIALHRFRLPEAMQRTDLGNTGHASPDMQNEKHRSAQLAIPNIEPHSSRPAVTEIEGLMPWNFKSNASG